MRDLLAKGKRYGFNTMRTWVHSVNPQYAMQVGGGTWRWPAWLAGFDFSAGSCLTVCPCPACNCTSLTSLLSLLLVSSHERAPPSYRAFTPPPPTPALCCRLSLGGTTRLRCGGWTTCWRRHASRA